MVMAERREIAWTDRDIGQKFSLLMFAICWFAAFVAFAISIPIMIDRANWPMAGVGFVMLANMTILTWRWSQQYLRGKPW